LANPSISHRNRRTTLNGLYDKEKVFMPIRQVDERLNPFPWYRRMREKSPVQYEASYQTWMVFGYPDVQRVLSDAAVFSSASGGGAASSDPLDSSLIAPCRIL
ncbi:MAG: hypothetical protein ACREP9_03110, partial [Candidatus Dormibacteraceae bacterium]